MMPSHETKGEGWKENIITNPPEDEDSFDENAFAYKQEVKSKIVNFLDRDGKREQEIAEEIDEPEDVVEQMLAELAEEDALEVEA